VSARGILTKFVNEKLREKNESLEGKISDRVYRAFGVKLSRSQSWHWLADEMRKQRNASVTLPAPKARKVKKTKRGPSVVRTEFYKSDAWRALRFLALKASDGCCCLCGRSNRGHGIILHVDHIKPRSRYPALALTLSNLQVLCEDCNMGKGNRDDTDWR
jgi:5-methylcytosine-specific restriction endonuclease McrA